MSTIPHPEFAASQDTLASLQQLDPSPIESPSYEEDKELVPPTPSPPTRAATLGLSGNHGTGYYCRFSKALGELLG